MQRRANNPPDGDADRPRLALVPEARLALRDHVRRKLRTAILSGDLAAGERLNERALADELEVSTTPLKEALRQLEAEGLIEVLPRRGVVVRYNRDFAEEMILARASLESAIAALAARRADEGAIARLGATVATMREATDAADIAQLIRLNEVFHGEIHAAARSIHLTRLVAQQQFYDDTARRVIHRKNKDSRAALDEHSAICAAIVARHPDEASTLMGAHVRRSGRLYLAAVFGKDQGHDI
ncbi:MAG: GntR family transcriptional regulator [Acuticoccus sp.]